MKSLLALLVLATFTATGTYAQSSSGSSSNQTQARQPATFADETSGIKRPTPTPAPAGPVNPKDKKPLTAILAKDEKGKEATNVFSTMEPKIYVVWKDDTGVKGDKLHVVWYAVNTNGAMAKNKKIHESTQTVPGPGAYGAPFIGAPAKGFPPGSYRVDVYDGTKLGKSLPFEIKK